MPLGLEDSTQSRGGQGAWRYHSASVIAFMSDALSHSPGEGCTSSLQPLENGGVGGSRRVSESNSVAFSLFDFWCLICSNLRTFQSHSGRFLSPSLYLSVTDSFTDTRVVSETSAGLRSGCASYAGDF